jgi:uncharacterized membrane protein
MSNLVAIAYPDDATAQEVGRTLVELQKEHSIELDDLVVAVRQDDGNALTDYGIDDKFMKDLGTRLEPGGAALFVLVRSGTPDKVLPRISEYGGEVLHTSLPGEAERTLQDALTEGASVT